MKATDKHTGLTAERARELLAYDPETGLFTRRVQRMKYAAGSVAGFQIPSGYIDIGIGRRTYKAHRIAWLITYGTWPINEIDHINGDRADNRLVNLRDVTRILNMQNLRYGYKNARSGLLGVAWNKKLNKFSSCIRVSGEPIYLGLFPTAEAAHQAYLMAKRELHQGSML